MANIAGYRLRKIQEAIDELLEKEMELIDRGEYTKAISCKAEQMQLVKEYEEVKKGVII